MISVTILTKNCQETLEATLNSLSAFDEILILDTGSTDATLEIVRRFPNATIKTSPFIGFGPLHNLATEFAKNDWILSIDSDEIASPTLFEEIQKILLDPKEVYFLQRYNFFNGKHIKGCAGWHPDWVARLYHRKHTKFDDAPVHEKICLQNCKLRRLNSVLLHTPFRRIDDFLFKMQTYSTLFSQQSKKKKKGALAPALFHSWYAFLKSYFLKMGFLSGKEGFIISMYNAHTTFYKYLKRDF